MPSRHSRNARNKQHTHVYQQPTPSSRPSPDVYPSSLLDDSASSSGDDAVGSLERRTAEERTEGLQQDYSPGDLQEILGERMSVWKDEFHQPAEPLGEVVPEQALESFVPSRSLPTPPLPESLDAHQPQSEPLLSPLWDDSGTSDDITHSPILATLAGHSRSPFGDAFSRAAANNPSPPSSPYTESSLPTGAIFTSSSPITSRLAKVKSNVPHRVSGAGRAASMSKGGTLATLSGNALLSSSSDYNETSPESADRAPIAYSGGTADLNETLHFDNEHMEGTIRPSRRGSSGYNYGFSPVEPPSEFVLGSLERSGHKYGNSGEHGSSSSIAGGRARRAPQYEEPTTRGSALSRALANPQSSKQSPRISQSAVQSTISRKRSSSTTAIPVSINGAPDEGDTIVSARWDYSLSGRRLLFLSYYPSGLQIWDCTDLGSISEMLNLPSRAVRQLIADASIAAKPNEDSPDMVIEYTGIISEGLSSEEQSPMLGLLVTPTEDKRDSMDEASDSVFLASEDEVNRESTDLHSFLLIYSLVDHRVSKIIRISGLSIGGGRFEVGTDFAVVSTTIPPALHILSATTFDVLHLIPASDILPFCHKTPSSHGLSTSHLSSRHHSFLEATSHIVNGIYNNYNEHFNDKYHNSSNHNNVSSPTVEHRFSSNFSSSHLDSTGDHFGRQSSDHNRQRRTTLHEQASQAAELPFTNIPEPTPLPAPIFSVSGRLLAYASQPEGNTSLLVNGVQPRTSSTLSNAAVSTASAFGSTLSAQLASLGGAGGASGALGALGGISQADVGNAALKVGGSVLNGMKTLGGLAYKSAVAAATDSGSDRRMNRRGHQASTTSRGGVGGLANRFFSRSAPAATSSTEDRERRYSTSSIGSTGIDGYEVGKTTGVGQAHSPDSNRRPRTLPIIENGYHVTVLDFASLMTGATDSPPVVMHFLASKSQPVASMRFSASGTFLSVALRDGQAIQVYDIRADPASRLSDSSKDRNTSHGHSTGSDVSQLSPSPPLNDPAGLPLLFYNLRRGRTPAVIESVEFASDGRWTAITTRKRTVHVFAVNPYGGLSDIASHTSGRVRNISEMPAMPTDLYPLIRLRVSKTPRPEQSKVPLAVTFLEPSVEEERRLPPNLLPPLSSPNLQPTHQHSYGSVSTVMSSSPSVRSDTLSLSPHQYFGPNGRPRNFQDILLFDSTDGVLSLRRITSDVKLKPNDGPSILGTNLGSLGNINASRSLPGTNAGGRLSVSTSPGISSVATIGQSPTKAENGELIGRESTIFSWNLRRGKDWPEKREAFVTSEKGSPKKAASAAVGQPNWLAQAELSTYSRSSHVLPRSIYLSHQFTFRALGEDYHALIRQYKFDIAGTKIEVRKGVEVSAYPTGNSESFIEGGAFAIHYDRRRLSSSFEEPLASALTGGLDHIPSQPVLPMYPNGAPGNKPRSFKNSIPIRTMTGIGDGMSGGIGRFRREINKVRSPQFAPSSDSSLSASVPLEFDEEDEDFLSPETEQDRSEDGSQPVSPGERHREADNLFLSERPSLDDNHNQWPGWVGEDRNAVEEAEMFDDISPVGFMDEEIKTADERQNKKRT